MRRLKQLAPIPGRTTPRNEREGMVEISRIDILKGTWWVKNLDKNRTYKRTGKRTDRQKVWITAHSRSVQIAAQYRISQSL